jgi:CBS-domain-containing membrane protein
VFHTTTVGAVMRPAPDRVAPAARPTPSRALRTDAPLADALPLLADHSLDEVPVVDGDGRLVGVCTRHDLLSARTALLDHETPEPGWLARRRYRAADDLARGPAS